MTLPKLGLLARISLALLAVSFVPLVLVSTQLIGLTTDAQKDAVWGAQLKAASAAGSHINEYVYLRRGLAQSTASNPTLLDDPKSADSADVLRSLLESFVDLEAMALVNGEREVVVQAQREGATAGMLDVALAAPRSEVEFLDFSGTPFGRFEAEIPGTVASVVLVFNLGSIVDDALHPSGLLASATLALIDGDLRTLAGPSGLLDGFDEDQLATAPRVEITSTIDRELASSVPLGERDWFVVVRQPTEEALKRLVDMRRRAGLVLGLTSLLIFGLIGTAFRSIVRPIRELTRMQSELTGVELASRGTEIDQLRAAFEILERRVREKEALEETFLGRYQILDVLGEGAMGIVFRGWDPNLERPVALKTIRLDRELPEEEREQLAQRLVQEAKTVARFTDPHIVSVYDVQQAGDMAFIAMELIEGHSLDHYLRMHGARPEEECARVGAAIARALASAHDHQIVHQDIKPGNVLLADDGQIKVVDFGVASLVTALTQRDDDVVFGTPGYMPPEALDGEGFGPAGDLFSLGALLYQMGTGTAPFVGGSLSQTIRKTYAGVEALEPLSEANPAIGGEFEDAVNQLLAAKPEDRPAEALLVAANLDRFVPRGGIVWRPTWRTTGPGSDATHERPKSRLLPSSVIDRLADR